MALSDDERVARVTMLKSRFADTIDKAKQALNFSDAKAPAKDRRVEKVAKTKEEANAAAKKDHEARAKNVKKRAHSASRGFKLEASKVENEAERALKRRRGVEAQREAARMAIDNVTKTLDFDNLCVIEEFRKLTGCANASYSYGSLLVS